MTYTIQRTTEPPPAETPWEADVWGIAESATIGNVRPESSDHHPLAQVRVLYDDDAMHGIFRVEDRFVRCVHSGFQAPVCRDSCVEFFFEPHVGDGYLNMEFNCGGSFLSYYIRDCTRIGDDGFADFTAMTPEQAASVRVWTSLPERVEPERTEPVVWTLQFRIPFCVVEAFTGPLGKLQGVEWRGNFYKCGDETSHPHWLSWAPVDELNFHLPRCFETLRFA